MILLWIAIELCTFPILGCTIITQDIDVLKIANDHIGTSHMDWYLWTISEVTPEVMFSLQAIKNINEFYKYSVRNTKSYFVRNSQHNNLPVWWSNRMNVDPYTIAKKNAYALKTPHVVALPFIYGVGCIQFHTLLETPKNVFWPSDLDPWPMTLSFELDLDILPLDLHTEIQVCMSVRLAVGVVTHRHTHRHTHRRCQNYYTRHVTYVTWGVMMLDYTGHCSFKGCDLINSYLPLIMWQG